MSVSLQNLKFCKVLLQCRVALDGGWSCSAEGLFGEGKGERRIAGGWSSTNAGGALASTTPGLGTPHCNTVGGRNGSKRRRLREQEQSGVWSEVTALYHTLAFSAGAPPPVLLPGASWKIPALPESVRVPYLCRRSVGPC
jgi:hypothetical protein